MRSRPLMVLAALAALFNVFAAVSFIESSAPAYDEPLHIASGYSYWKTGEFRMNIKDHPPLAELAAAVPLLFMKLDVLETSRQYQERDQYDWADLFVYQNGAPAGKIVNAARLFSWSLWTALLAAYIFFFARELVSAEAGLLAVSLFLLAPVFISGTAVVGTDAAAAAFYLAAFLFARLFARRSAAGEAKNAWASLALCALATALAMASKFSMAVLPGFVLLMWALDHCAAGRAAELKELALPALVYLAGTFLALAAVYGFSQFGLYFQGLAATASRLEAGRPSFIYGRHSMSGVWWYFPFAFLVKNPPALLALFAAGLWATLREGKKSHLWLYAPLILYFAFSIASRLQIGVRHLLPAMPFCFILAGAGAAALLEGKRLRWAAAVLLAAAGVSAARAHPHYLAYFSEAAGGPENGYRLLADSNLDWGQDLETLGDRLKKEGSPPVYLAYFGAARPEYYGIKYIPFGMYSDVSFKGGLDTPCAGERVLLAVSATNLQGVYYGNKEFFGWLRDREPVFRAGWSIFLYDLTDDAAARAEMTAIFRARGLPRHADCLIKRSSEK